MIFPFNAHDSNFDFSDEILNFKIKSIDLNFDNKTKVLNVFENIESFRLNIWHVKNRKFDIYIFKKKTFQNV